MAQDRIGTKLDHKAQVSMENDELDSIKQDEGLEENNIIMQFSYQIIHRIFAVLFFFICVCIVFYSHELGQLRWFIWDTIIVMFLYSFIQWIHKMNSWKLIGAILILAYGIEILQYFHFVKYMWWGENQVMRLIFGAVYDPMDILAYTLGWILIYLIDFKMSK